MMMAHMGAGFLLTKLFCLLFLLGVIFFIIWAARTLDKKQLKNLFAGLLIVGLLGMIGSHFLIGKGDCDKDGKMGKFRGCDKAIEEVETPEI